MSKSSTYVTRIAITVALGGFLLGFDASVISGVVKFIEPEFNLSKIELGWAVGSITLTAALGMLISGPVSNVIGRRSVMKYAAVLFTISAIGSALAPTFFTLIIARMIGGLAVGASLILAPMYIAEVAPADQRGRLVSFNQLNIVIGISTAFFTNYLILKLGESNTEWVQSLGFEQWNWRWMLGLEALPAVFYYFGLLFVPRSPRWLMLKGNREEATAILEKVSGTEEANRQIEIIDESIAQEKSKEKIALAELFKPAMRNVIIIGLVVGIFQQIIGINAVLFYAPMIFELTGIGTDASFIQAILVGLTNLIATLIAMATIDRLGRKPLLVVGMAGMGVTLLLLFYSFNTATYTFSEDNLTELPEGLSAERLAVLKGTTYTSDLEFKAAISDALGEDAGTYESALITIAADMNTVLILISILGFVAFYAVSIGPVMWVLFAELFPNRIRALAISFVGLINLAVAFFVQLLFPWELSVFGSATSFLIYGVMAVIGFAFILLKVPETKGKSLEELEELLVK